MNLLEGLENAQLFHPARLASCDHTRPLHTASQVGSLMAANADVLGMSLALLLPTLGPGFLLYGLINGAHLWDQIG